MSFSDELARGPRGPLVLPTMKKTYTADEIKLWAESYKESYSFCRVGKLFGVNYKTVRTLLIENKTELGILTKQDLRDANLRKCSVCKEIKPEDQFGSHWQKSRCKVCIATCSKNYRAENLDKCIDAERNWYNSHKKEKAAYKKTYTQAHSNDPTFKLKKRIRNRVRDAIKHNKPGSAVKCLGCTVEELKLYLEQKFYNHPITGVCMTWDNYSYSGWHLDHIVPLLKFDLTDLEQFSKACHYTNLQPLWVCDHKNKTLLDLKTVKTKTLK